MQRRFQTMSVELLKTVQTKHADQDAKIRRRLNVALHVHFLYPSLHLMFEHPLPPMMLPNHARISARDAREEKHGSLHA